MYRQMLRRSRFLALLLLLSPAIGLGAKRPRPAPRPLQLFPELSAGFDLLYEQKFAEAREAFANWQSRNPEDPFGAVALAASYLFEELSVQRVLTSDFSSTRRNSCTGLTAGRTRSA